MHIKKDFNFFSGQEMQTAKTKTLIVVVISTVAILVMAVILMIQWGRSTITVLEEELGAVKMRLENPETQLKLKDLDGKKAQLESIEAYISISNTVLNRIQQSNFASTNNLAAMQKEIPNSIQIDMLDIQGSNFKLNCKTNKVEDIATMLHNLESSPNFMNVKTNGITTDTAGISSFMLDFTLEGGSVDAAK